MTWQIPWVVAGVNEVPLDISRTMAYVTTSGREGVVASDHLKVTQTSTPSGSILVSPGVLVTNNRFLNASFESYVGRNWSTSVQTSVAATGATSRTDLVYAHITDTGQSGHYPVEPTEPLPIETRIITGVASDITRLQDHPGYENQSGYALARITRPANTTTVQTSHITDLRHLLEEATGPIGQITMYAGNVAPFAWLICSGQEVSRTTYAALFSVIGTTYGAGNGSTTFTLPDFRGRGPLGSGTGDASGASVKALGSKVGKETHAISATELPTHSHGMDAAGTHSHGGATVNAGSHSHTYEFPNSQRDYAGGGLGAWNSFRSIGNTSTAGDHAHVINADGNHTHTIHNAGSSTPMSMLQPSTIVNFIIKAY